MLALNAELVAQSTKGGERIIPIDGFFEGPFTTTLRADEIATAIRIPLPSGSAGGSYHKLERKVGDFATVAVSVQVELDGRKVKKAGIGMTSVGATNLKAKQAEKSLIGHELKDDVIAEAAKLAAAESEPKDDIRGTAAYKKDMVRVFVQRGLKAALARAQEVRA
jgi:carbon-monoxide dehydrogenase medium subunit